MLIRRETFEHQLDLYSYNHLEKSYEVIGIGSTHTKKNLRIKKNCYFARPLALFTAISKIMVLDKMQPAFKKKSYRDTTLHINTIVF